MKIACLRWKYTLAKYAAGNREIPPSGSLARHLAACRECSREFDWYCAAHRDLQRSLTAEKVAADFAAATWERFSAATPPRQSPAAIPLLSAACAAGIVVVLLWWKPWVPTRATPTLPVTVTTKATVSRTAEQLAMQTSAAKSTAGDSLSPTPSEQRYAENPTQPHRRRGRTHAPQHMVRRQPSRMDLRRIAVAKSPTGTQPASWEQMASWYESHGDYWAAAAAYGQAVRENPTENRVFDAGRTSECAGDMAQAIDYYARLLTQERAQKPHSRQDSTPAKGASQWYENRNSI